MTIPRIIFKLAAALTAVVIVDLSLTSCGQTEDPSISALKKENAAEKAELDTLKRDLGEARVQTGPSDSATKGTTEPATDVGSNGKSIAPAKETPSKANTSTKSD